MEVLSITGFKKLCESIPSAIYIYDTDNQPRKLTRFSKTTTKYDTIIFMLSPDRVCLKNDLGSLSMDHIKCIRRHGLTNRVGEVFSIVCGDRENKDRDETYVIVVDKINK